MDGVGATVFAIGGYHVKYGAVVYGAADKMGKTELPADETNTIAVYTCAAHSGTSAAQVLQASATAILNRARWEAMRNPVLPTCYHVRLERNVAIALWMG